MPIGSFISDLVGPSVATYLTPALEGAGTGAIGSLLQGKNPLTGALVGGATGAGIGAFGGADGALAQALGLSGAQVNALIGGAGGALGYGLTGQNPLIGAALGGVGGYMYPGSGDKPFAASGDNSGYETGGADKAGGPGNGWTDAKTGAPADSSSYGAATAAGKGGGALGAVSSGILGGGDGSSGISKTALLLGALAALGSATTKPKQGDWTTPGPASNAANLGPTFNAPLNTAVPGRTATHPFANPTPSYWTYGGPEQTYFTGNSLKSYGFAGGGAIGAGMEDQGEDDGGDGEWSTATHGNYVQGPGHGQEDLIPARLANSEYVLTAADVSRIGQGSSEAGAKKLDEFRKHLANSSKQEQFIPRGQEKALGGLMEGVK